MWLKVSDNNLKARDTKVYSQLLNIAYNVVSILENIVILVVSWYTR